MIEMDTHVWEEYQKVEWDMACRTCGTVANLVLNLPTDTTIGSPEFFCRFCCRKFSATIQKMIAAEARKGMPVAARVLAESP